MVCSRNRNHNLLLHQSSWSQIVAEKSTRRKFQSSSFVTNFHLPTFHYSVSLLFVLSTMLRKLVSYLFYPIWGKSLTSLLFAIAILLASTRWIATVNIALHSTMWSNSYLSFATQSNAPSFSTCSTTLLPSYTHRHRDQWSYIWVHYIIDNFYG